jgi:hypothetical protein
MARDWEYNDNLHQVNEGAHKIKGKYPPANLLRRKEECNEVNKAWFVSVPPPRQGVFPNCLLCSKSAQLPT